MVHIRRDDVKVVEGRIRLRLTTYKKKGVSTPKEQSLPLTSGFGGALSAYIAWYDKGCSDGPKSTRSLFGLDLEDPKRSATMVSEALERAYAMAAPLSDAPQASPVTQSHALRRGAAVCMYALGIQINRICAWGGWKTAGSLDTYIRGRDTSLPSDTDRICYGWMVRNS